jgi:hypothetical protein
MKLKRKQKGINRVDNDAHHQHGFLARHFVDGEKITRQFSDKKYGGAEGAFKAAQEWLTEQAALRPARTWETHAPFQRSRPRSNTGILGISRTHDYARHDRSLKQEVFSVAFSDQGVRNCKKFYIHHYTDERDALADAIAFRKEKEREMLEYWKKKQQLHKLQAQREEAEV